MPELHKLVAEASINAPELLPVRPDGSCYLHKNHGSSQPYYLQGHHILPIAFQMDLWNEVRIQNKADVCGTGHDTVHAIMRELVEYQDKYKDLPSPYQYRKFRAEYNLAVDGLSQYWYYLGHPGTKIEA